MANMHVTEMGSQVDNSLVQAPHSPMAEVTATVLRAQAFTGASGAAMLARAGEELVCRSANGTCVPEFGVRMPVQGSFLGLAVEGKKAQKSDDAETDLRVENASYGPVKPKSILAVPVRSGEQVVGVLAVYSASVNAFNNTHMAILRTMADASAKHILQLPQLEAPKPAAKADIPKAAVTAAEPAKVQLPEPHRQELAAAVAQLVAPTAIPTVKPAPVPAPAAAKPTDDILVLAADPSAAPARKPAPVLESKPAALSAPRPRKIQFNPPPSLDLPQPRRRRNSKLKGPVRTAVIGLVAVALTAGWALNRSEEVPLPVAVAAPSIAPAAVEPAVDATNAASTVAAAAATTPVPATQTTPAAPAVPAVVPPVAQATPKTATKPTPAVSEATAVPSAEQKPEPAPVVLASEPKRSFTAASKEVSDAPQLAMASTPALPLSVAPAIATPALRKSDAVPAKLLQRAAPTYPPAALRLKTSGSVVLSAVVRKDGSVAEVKMVGGNPVFRDSAISAVRQWRYSPATLNGEPVETTAEIVLKFAAPK